jgi:hypothetical protein
MIKFRKLLHAAAGTAMVLSMTLLAPGMAFAADQTYSANTTIALTSPAINFTILANSVSTTLTVDTGGFTVVVPPSGTFTVTSASRDLNMSGNSSATVVSLSCSSGTARLVITAGASAETISVSPTSGQCISGGGGGGGGGGGAPSNPSPTISSFTASPSSISAGESSTLSWNVANATSLSVNQGVGTLPNIATGTKTVTPSVTTTYTLTVGNANGTVTASATVTIAGTTPAPATPEVPVNPAVPGTPAPPGAHSNGTLVLDGSTIYLIKDGQRYGFRDASEYKSHGFTFSQAVAASDTDKSLPMASGNIIKALEGTLVLDASDNKTVYMIGTNNTKRGFASAEVFKALGYSFANLPKINLTDYTVGAVITSSTDSHPEGALVLEGKTVWWILGGLRQGFESMAVFNTYGFATSKIVKANAADLALSEGALVKFRDGTLVKDGSDYYLISDGKKLQFASASDLTAKGYKTANAIKAGLANYESGGAVQ